MLDIDASTDTIYVFMCLCLSFSASEVPVILTKHVSFCALKLELRGIFLIIGLLYFVSYTPYIDLFTTEINEYNVYK